MFQFFKKLFQPEKSKAETIAEMELQKREMEAQLELLIELEEEIKRMQKESNS
ncbi:MAG: hypothetical protein AAF611_06710 [Bacteroidota bacterium]